MEDQREIYIPQTVRRVKSEEQEAAEIDEILADMGEDGPRVRTEPLAEWERMLILQFGDN